MNAQQIALVIDKQIDSLPKVSGGEPYLSRESNEILQRAVPSECETAFCQGINVMSEGERTTISFSTNKDWSVSLAETQSGDHWCTVSPSSGKAGNVTLTILVTSNAGYDDRNVVLKISADELTKNIIINQKQKDALTLTSDSPVVAPHVVLYRLA